MTSKGGNSSCGSLLGIALWFAVHCALFRDRRIIMVAMFFPTMVVHATAPRAKGRLGRPCVSEVSPSPTLANASGVHGLMNNPRQPVESCEPWRRARR